jgi:hypothetical protein
MSPLGKFLLMYVPIDRYGHMWHMPYSQAPRARDYLALLRQMSY